MNYPETLGTESKKVIKETGSCIFLIVMGL